MMKPLPFRRPHQPAGMASALAVISLSAMMVISAVAVDLLLKGVFNSGVTGRSAVAYLAAESGAEQVLWLAQYDAAFDEEVFNANCLNGQVRIGYGSSVCGSYNHVIGGDANYFYTVTYGRETIGSVSYHVFTVVGNYYTSRRSVEVRYAK